MKKRVIVIFSILFILFTMSLVLLYLKNEKPIITYTDDEIKFKEYYEKYNNTNELINVNIKEDNNVVYINNSNINDIIKGTNIIYIGNYENNQCRKIINSLIILLNKNKVDKLYYYDIKDTSDKKDIYDKLLKIVKKSEENDELAIPIIIFMKDGKYIGSYINNNEENNFENEILKYINIMNSNVCEEDKGC